MTLMKKIAILLLCLVFSSNILNAGLVYFANIKKKNVGFIVKSGEDYYAITSQAALMSLGRFAIKTFDGTTIKQTGPLELSYYSDAARMKIDPGVMKDKALEFGGKVDLGAEVEVYSISIADNIDSKSNAKVDGIGMYAFSIDKETDNDSVGTPVLSKEGKVLGVLSKGNMEFDIEKSWGTDEKLKVVERKNKLAARMDVDVRWVDAAKAGFDRAAEEVVNAAEFQSEFLPLFNFWCKNPYRELPEDIVYPRELKSWVKDHNYKTKAYDKIIPRCAENPSERKGLINNVMGGTLERALKLSKFPQNKVRQMQIPWKTPFLKSCARIYLRNWYEVTKMMKLRIINMAYKLPYNFDEGNKKGSDKMNKKKKDNKKKNNKKKK